MIAGQSLLITGQLRLITGQLRPGSNECFFRREK
jgi:hypothetical protein